MNLERILLIFDIDETLIYGTEKPLARQEDFGFAKQFYIYKRPFLDEFIREVSKLFELAVWSSASESYVKFIVDNIFPDPTILSFHWAYRRNTMRYNFELREHYPIKDLKKVRRLGYPRGRILIVDDSPEKAERNYGNAIYIKPFEGDLKDRELVKLLSYLQELANVPNVRAIEKRGWSWE